MRHSVAELMIEFHSVFGAPMSFTPNIPPPEVEELRKRLLAEEVEELFEAMDERDLKHIAQELADVVYVAYGMALAYGFNLDAAVAEVHRANMSKLGPNGEVVYDEGGKVLKGEHYRKPDMSSVVGA